MTTTRRFLFLKEQMAWPRASGHDVHTFHMMQALTKLGHQVALATIDTPPPEAIENGGLEKVYVLNHSTFDAMPEITLSKWQNKFRNYWGIDETLIRKLGAAARDFHADTVVVSGLRVLPYLGAIPSTMKSVWYAADEWVWHHLSQLRLFKRRTWGELRQAIDKGLYERAYRKRLDRVWVVSAKDARAFRWFAGVKRCDILPNGVDADHYHHGDEAQLPASCVFWGRLDFGPNIQALEWFLAKVWPLVRKQSPESRFDVFGFQPTPEVKRLCEAPGVTLCPDQPDIRAEVRRRQIVVLPFISGGGIKNKLLEAAAMSKAILATPRVTEGLMGTPPIVTAKSASVFASELVTLMNDELRRTKLGTDARAWVMSHHTWAAAARIALEGLNQA